MYFLVYKVMKSVNLGTLQFLNFYHQTPCEICPIYLSGNMKEFIWKKFGKAKILYRNVKDFWGKMKNYMEKCWVWLEKWKNLYGKNMEKLYSGTQF